MFVCGLSLCIGPQGLSRVLGLWVPLWGPSGPLSRLLHQSGICPSISIQGEELEVVQSCRIDGYLAHDVAAMSQDPFYKW